MKNLKERFNEKQYRWVKEEFKPFREKWAMWVIAVGAFILVATWLGYLNVENYPYMKPFYYFTAILGGIILGIGFFMVITGFNLLYKLDEVKMGNAVVYHYVKDSETPLQIFASVSDAEQSIENPDAEKEEP